MTGTYSATKTLHVAWCKTKFSGGERSQGVSVSFALWDEAFQRLADLPLLPGALGALLTERNIRSLIL